MLYAFPVGCKELFMLRDSTIALSLIISVVAVLEYAGINDVPIDVAIKHAATFCRCLLFLILLFAI